LSKVTRHSDGVDLSRLKRVYAIRAVPFEGELLMLFSIVRHQPRNGLGGDDRRDRRHNRVLDAAFAGSG
jgi:hypothetical protein